MIATRAKRARDAMFVALVAFGAPAACGGSSPDGPSGAPDGSGSPGVGGDAARFVDQLADEMCATAAACCPGSGYAAPSDCGVRARQQLHEAVDPEIVAGAMFSAGAAADCLAAYRGLTPTCPAVWSSFAPCHQALIGTSPPGEPCDRGCAPSNEGDVVCAFSVRLGGDAGQTRSPSICQVEITSPPGGMCDTEVTKPILRVCDVFGGSWCFGGLCSVPVAMGGGCHGNDCASGGYCRDSVCQPKLAVGEACAGTHDECVPGTSCEPSTMICKAADSWKKLCGGDFG